MRRVYVMLIVLIVVGFAARGVPSISAAEPLCFPTIPGITNCISGRFLTYWQQNGGLPVFGYPLTPAQQEKTPEGSFLTQYFERQRFELHSENKAPFDVLLGRLGAEIDQRTQGDWRSLPAGSPQRGCVHFDVTRHTVCDPFLRYWRSHGLLDPALDSDGRSLALLGLPLTEPRMERNPDGDLVLTQWFERARLEDHGSKGVLLGRLGAEILPIAGVPPGTLSAEFQQLLDLINAERTQRGLVALVVHDQLNAAAQSHSDDMAANNFFSHTGSDGSDIAIRIARTGYKAVTWGENLAAGFSSPADIVRAWLESEGHRQNMLNPAFREIGFGYAFNQHTTFGHYWTNAYASR